MTLRLRDYQLEDIVGRGATGVVWRARAPSGPVAVKVFEAGAELVPREIRMAARLHHPALAAPYDHGTVPADLQHPDLPAGAAWVAMELLYPPPGRGLAWPQLRRLAGDLLGALGHAHARDVLHRDVKPENLLVDREGRWRLVDFGIAVLRGERERLAGTRGFMAPEQAQGRGWLVGPWSDLYSLGRTLQHLAGRGIAVPEGFPEWLGRMTAEEPRLRFPRAADALGALRALGPLGAGSADLGDLPTGIGTDGRTSATWRFDVEPAALGPEPLPAPRSVPLPERWDLPAARPVADGDLALPLVALRTFPLVGRAEARAALWDGLRRAVAAGRAAAVGVGGPPGSGRTRLVHELASTVEELGCGRGVRLVGSVLELGAALAPLPADRSAALGQLADLLGLPPDDDRVAAHVALRREPERFAEGERAALLLDLLARAARDQPVVVAVGAAVTDAGALLERLDGLEAPVFLAVAGPATGVAEAASLGPLPRAEARALLHVVADLDERTVGALLAGDRRPGPLLGRLARAVGARPDATAPLVIPSDELAEAPALPDRERAVAGWLATLGTRAREPWVADAVGAPAPDVRDALHALARAGFATEADGRWTLLPQLRSTLRAEPEHRARAAAAAPLLLAAGEPERAAHLFAEAGSLREAADAFQAAHLDRFRSGGSLGEARRLCRHQIAALEAAGDRRAAGEAKTWLHFYAVQLELDDFGDDARELLAEAEREGWPEVVGGALQNLATLPDAEDPAGTMARAEAAYLAGGRPGFAEGIRLLRWILFAPDAAERLRERPLAHFGERSRWATIARVLARDGRTEEARSALAEALRHPDDQRGTDRIVAEVQLAVGDGHGAGRYWAVEAERVIDARSPSARQLLRNAAFAAILRGDWDEAEAHLGRLPHYPDDLALAWARAAVDAHRVDVATAVGRELTARRAIQVDLWVAIRDHIGPTVLALWEANGHASLAARISAALVALRSAPRCV